MQDLNITFFEIIVSLAVSLDGRIVNALTFWA